ncbi:GNAT family N-acetyltransferase [Bacillus sp. AFS055030]|uniref:GNAT family N-acetyltransferase n=1 Tax=Bacillus sp. AFS055030 TaxID=2033507 RepID=UPI000BFCE34D|nr:GNAT family N-acetyltransferase [Bacillus sp. AFS055030]PGL70408.1 GNAT family N-acetyltransferase [Bacillus sp. AFS055030]
MKVRLAEIKDIDQLIKMRWDFTLEDYETGRIKASEYNDFYNECRDFLLKALNSKQWYIWVAEIEGTIASHIYIELIQKVPRPGRVTNPFAFMTNVYTLKDYRGQGIGGILISQVNNWVCEMNFEFVIVWPSEQGVNFYKRYGYNRCSEAMEYFPNFDK